MTRLQKWMESKGEKDHTLAAKLNRAGTSITRAQVNRIRRGRSGASKDTALALQKLTGIPWHHFIGRPERAAA